MSIKANLPLFMFLLTLLFLSSVLPSLCDDDPKSPRWEIERCQRRCERDETHKTELQKCQQRCEEEAIKKREQEQERGQAGDPRQQYEKCRQVCERQSGRQRQECESRCQRQYQESQRSKGRDSRGSETNNPYYFHSGRLQSRVKTQQGSIKVLENFNQRSELLRGIENYRLAILEANPSTFVVPHHTDAESVVVVLNGQGTISYVLQEKRESYNLKTGDVIRIPAGATVYLINDDNNEKMSLANLFIPVNVPGKFREYFAAGGENPESFYRVFSNDVLESAFNTPRNELERIFGQQRQGMIVKASGQQLKALSQHVSSAKQKGHDIRGPFNLNQQHPLYSNRYGKLIETSPNDRKQLQDLDISVSSVEIQKGALMVPHYNSKATSIVLVVEGSGRIEMACPHLARESYESEERRSRKQYESIRCSLSSGDVFIVPAGDPVAIIASQNQNLRLIAFGINALDNQRNFLAGKDNILNQIEREAKELCLSMQKQK